MKEWSRYQARVALEEMRKLRNVQAAQQRALRCLAAISPHHLYAAAIRPVGIEQEERTSGGSALLLSASGPFATPPPRDPKSYDAPDGEIVDITPTFEYEFELDRRFLVEEKRTKFVKITSKKGGPV